jgi:uncharacterized protein (DUF697 family)
MTGKGALNGKEKRYQSGLFSHQYRIAAVCLLAGDTVLHVTGSGNGQGVVNVIVDDFSNIQATGDQLSLGWGGPLAYPPMPGSSVAIVGLPDAGKRTLLNSLWGWEALPDKPSQQLVREFGLFSLIDLQDDPLTAETILLRLANARAIVYVLDGEIGLRPDDFQWITRLRAVEAPLVVVLNKRDRVIDLAQAMADLENRLSMKILPLCAQDVEAVHSEFLPLLLKACPQLDVLLAREIAGIRHRVASRIILRNALASVFISLEPVPLVDVSALVALQLRLVDRIAEIYGLRQKNGQRREIMFSTILGLTFRFTGQTLAKVVPVAGWLVSGLLGASATWVVGRTALAYYGDEIPSFDRLLSEHWERLKDAIRRR